MPNRIKDLTGQRFGRLTVLGLNEEKVASNGGRYWDCMCDCGNFKTVSGAALRQGNTKSCGCYIAEIRDNNLNLGRIKWQHNEYDLDTYDYGVGYIDDKQFFFDKEDYNLISPYKWCMSHDYVIAYDPNTRKQIRLHRLIMGVQDDDWKAIIVDHINGNPLDNRKTNLRIATHSENQMNRKVLCNNTSGITGVNYEKAKNAWHARLIKDDEYMLNKCFKTYEEAVIARKEAEEKYYGKYSYDNSRCIDNVDKNEKL